MSQTSQRSTHGLPSLQPLCLKLSLRGGERLKVCLPTATERNREQDLGLCAPDSSVLPLSRQCLVCPWNLIPHQGDNDLNTIQGASKAAAQAGGNKRDEDSVVLLYLHNCVTDERAQVSELLELSNRQSRAPAFHRGVSWEGWFQRKAYLPFPHLPRVSQDTLLDKGGWEGLDVKIKLWQL